MRMLLTNKYFWISLSVVLILLITLFFVLAVDNDLKVRKYTIESDKVEKTVRLVMLSDLHRSYYGKGQEELIAMVAEQEPDAILLCGDIFDEHQGAVDAALPLLAAIGEKYPCYYVAGNHEYGAETTDEQVRSFRKTLKDTGITVLEAENRKVQLNGTVIEIGGIPDDNQYTMYRPDGLCIEGNFYRDYQKISDNTDPDCFSVLLCHRPLAELARNSSYDLVLSGHVHGGQWRLPGLINGVYGPNQGLFPKYAGGSYAFDNGTVMIVGRGLSKTLWIPRLFNPPEVVLVVIQPKGQTQ